MPEYAVALLAAVAAGGQVYRRPDSGDLLYTPRDSYNVTNQMNELASRGLADLGDDMYWTVTNYGRRWLADNAVNVMQLAGG